MNRPLELVNTTGSVDFDGLKAVVWVVTMQSSVPASRVRIKNISPGQLYTFIFHQDGIGGHTFEWPANVKDASAVNATAGATSVMNFIGYTGGALLADLPGTWSQ